MSFRFLTTIPVIALIIAAKTHGSIDDIVPGTQADGAKCDIYRSEFWNFINWYFSRSQIMRVVLLSRSPDMSNYTDIFNNVIQRLVHNTRLPMIISSRDLTYEDDRIGYSDRYSWQGTLFPLRPAQQQTAQRTRRKRQAPAIGDEAAVPAVTTPGRKDEPQHGILVIVESLQILDDYLTGSARSPFRSPRDNYIVIVRFSSDNATDANNSTTDGRRWPEQVESIVRRLWTDYGIANLYLMAPCEDASDGTVGTVASYFPFLLRSTNDSAAPPDGGEPLTADEYGRCRWWTIDRLEYSMRSLRRTANMRGYPFRVSIFERYPTALPVNRMSQVLARSYFNNIARLSGGFAGFDGLVLGNMAERLNFRSVVVSPSGGSDFGWVGANGSFYGSIGDVLYRRAQISVNGRFVAEYGTDEIDFMYPVYFDDFCIVAPKALMIPEWLAIFRCFSKTVWALIVGTIVVCACGWYLLQRWTHFKYKQNLHRRTSIENATICYQRNFFAVFIEMWIIYFSAASTHMPANQLERIFMTACLLGNLIIVGSFQGSLTTSFSTTAYYKDIDTLSELDASGLPIGTTSASLADIFGTGDTPVLLSLISKFRVSAGGGQATIDRTAYDRDTCCIERCADIKLIIVDKYEKPDGTVLLHPMRESPKTCHIAYVVKKGWPFFPVFQDLIHRFTEAGLMQKWYEQNQQSIIQEKRIQRRIESDDQHVLTMIDLQTSFYLLVLGQLFSVMLFVAEIIHARWFK